MFQRCQQVCLSLEIAHDGAAHQGVTRLVYHFFDGNQFNHIREVHIPSAQDRAGFYTFETIESLLRLEFLADTTVHPEWQRLSPGDPVRLAPPGWLGRKYGLLLTVSRIVEIQTIVFIGAPPEFPWHAVWSFHLESHYDDQCRLLVRTRAGLRHPGQLFITELAGPAVTLTVRGMLLGIKERAETAQRAHEKSRASTTQHA